MVIADEDVRACGVCAAARHRCRACASCRLCAMSSTGLRPWYRRWTSARPKFELRVETCVEQDVPALGILVHVVESACHVQRDLDKLAPSEHLVVVEPLAKRVVLGELKHHVRQYM